MWVANTNFTKSTLKIVTHRHVGSIESLDDTHAGAADQIDFFLATQRWKNTVQDAETKPVESLGSDHFPVIAAVKVKLKKPHASDPRASASRQIKKESLTQFNIVIKRQINQYSNAAEDIPIGHWDFAIKLAADSCADKKSVAPKKPWITPDTLLLIKNKHLLERSPNRDDYLLARKTFAKAVTKRLGNLACKNCRCRFRC